MLTPSFSSVTRYIHWLPSEFMLKFLQIFSNWLQLIPNRTLGIVSHETPWILNCMFSCDLSTQSYTVAKYKIFGSHFLLCIFSRNVTPLSTSRTFYFWYFNYKLLDFFWPKILKNIFLIYNVQSFSVVNNLELYKKFLDVSCEYIVIFCHYILVWVVE